MAAKGEPEYTTLGGEPEYTTLGVKNLEFEIQGETYVWDFIMYELKDYI